MRNILLVTNFDESVTGSDLERLFSRIGKVTAAWLSTHVDIRYDKFHRCGVVEMEDDELASSAIQSLDGKLWRGRRLSVTYPKGKVYFPIS